MTGIRADQTTIDFLSQVRQPVEVQDGSGRVIGVFSPGTPEEARLYLHAWLSLDPEDVRRQKQMSERTYTTQEVLEHLKSLEAG